MAQNPVNGDVPITNVATNKRSSRSAAISWAKKRLETSAPINLIYLIRMHIHQTFLCAVKKYMYANNMEDESAKVVFLYGTLMRGQPNHYFMGNDTLPSVQFLGEAETTVKYPLIIGGRWNLPMLVNHEGVGQIVKGELFRVEKADLQRLDKFEGHPEFYERTVIDVVQTDCDKDCDKETKKIVKCYTYFIKDHSEDYLNHVHYEKYDSLGPHGKAYVTSENEDHPDQH